jgi:hypothetical protein
VRALASHPGCRQILKSWAALAVPHCLRAAVVGHASWGAVSQCQAHVALLACLHQLHEDAPERQDRAAEALREEGRIIAAGLAAMPERCGDGGWGGRDGAVRVVWVG